ncbi:MAG TPA: hypothetical protein VHG08_06565 [Longimicrobium sp.]|nr:hypothetical protein [Longimicrobium sp.]
MRNPLLATIAALVACATITSAATAQAIHLPPVYRVTLTSDTVVMRIELIARDTQRFGTASTVNVHDGNLVINTPGRASEVISLGNRTIGDLVNTLQLNHEAELRVSSNYPLYHARVLSGNDSIQALSKGIEFTASAEAPVVALGFGVVLSMTDQAASEASGLLSQTGFQLDLVGVHQLFRGARGRAKLLSLPAVYLQARLGLSADQPLEVDKQTEASPGPDAAGQFEEALEQADLVALTGQVDLVWPLHQRPTHTELSLSFGYGVSWARPEPFVFPRIPVADSLAAAEGLFDVTRQEEVQQFLNQALPLRDYSGTVLIRFRNGDRPIFYLGAGGVVKDILRRGISFTRDAPGALPHPLSLQHLRETPDDLFWRAMFGARIAGLLDVRVDAIGPIGERDSAPLLRIVLGRDFPLIR